MGFAADLIAECLTRQGYPAEDAKKAASDVMGVAVALHIIPAKHLMAWERGAKIYHLVGQRVEVIEISIRLGLTERHVYRLISEHLRWRRQGLSRSA